MSLHGSVIRIIKVTAFNLFNPGLVVLSNFGEKFRVFIAVQKTVLEGAVASIKDDHLLPWSSSSSELIRKNLSLRVKLD